MYVHQYSVTTNQNPMVRTWIKCSMYSSTRKWCLCIVSSPHLGDKSINTVQTWKLTGGDFTPGYRQRLWCLMKRMPTSHQPVSRFGSNVKSRNKYITHGVRIYSVQILRRPEHSNAWNADMTSTLPLPACWKSESKEIARKWVNDGITICISKVNR